MDQTTKKKGFIGALREHAGIQGESLSAFQAEYKKLDASDKKQLYAWMQAQGIDCEAPQAL